MTSPLPPLHQAIPENGGISSGVAAGIENPDAAWNNLKLGQQVVVRINPQSLQTLSGKVLVSLDLSMSAATAEQAIANPAEITLPPQMKLPENALEVQLRITAKNPQRLDLRIVSIDGRKAETFVSAPQAPSSAEAQPAAKPTAALVKTITAPQNLSLAPLRLQPLLSRELSAVGINTADVNRISSAVENLGLKIEIAALPESLTGTAIPEISTDSGAASTLGQDLATALKPLLEAEKISAPPLAENGKLPDTSGEETGGVQKISAEIGKFFDRLSSNELPAETVLRGERVVLKTPLGEVIPEQPLKISVGEKMLLRIDSLIGLPLKEKPFLSRETQVLPPLGGKITEILTPLQSKLPPEVYAEVMEKIPADNAKMLSNIMSFLKAAGEEKIEHWLGAEITDKIRMSGAEGRQALSQLESLIVDRREENSLWRIIEIPFYSAENLSRIRVALRRFKEGEYAGNRNRNKAGAARFVVDTSFTVLGGFQFDGFSLPAERRFDLIIRTEKEVGEDFCAQIMQLFRHSLAAVDYAGNIRINIKEKFIKLCEDEPEDTILRNGIFI